MKQDDGKCKRGLRNAKKRRNHALGKMGSQSNLLTGWERLFVSIIRQAIRRKEFEFFHNGACEKLADFLGVDVRVADLVKNRVVKNFQNSAYFN